jgi:hypothetical protein
MAAWAAAVLAAPDAVLAARNTIRGLDWYRVETLAGDLVLDAVVRGFEDVSEAREPERYAGTVYHRQLREQVLSIAHSRIVTWNGRELLPLAMAASPDTVQWTDADRNALGERFSLWSGVGPMRRTGFWYPEPKLPWHAAGNADRAYRVATSPAAAIALMRGCLARMAHETAPEPSMPKPGA